MIDTQLSLAGNRTVISWCLYWFCSNLSITFFNKYALSGFNLSPIQVTLAHMVFTFVGCLIVQRGKFPSLTSKDYQRMLAFSFIFAFNIIYSQLGMKLTSLSLNQVTRAMTPVFQATLEYMLMSKVHTPYNLLPLVPVCCGIGLASMGELNLTATGLFVSVSSVFISALKGVLSMKILQRDLKAKLQEFTFLLITTPFAVGWLLLFNWLLPLIITSSEGTGDDGDDTGEALHALETSESSFTPYVAVILSFGGLLAFNVNVASIGTVKRTSATAMGVMANVKQAVTICLAMFAMESDWTVLKLTGIVVTICGAAWYSYRKEVVRQRDVRQTDLKQQQEEEERVEMGLLKGDASKSVD